MDAPSAKKTGNRTLVPRLCNAVLWILFCGLAGTGMLLAFRLPPGSRGGRGLSALGWGRHDWGDLHTWLSYGFVLMVLVHLALHRRWFWQVAAKKRIWPILIGIPGGLAAIVVLTLLPVKSSGSSEESDHDEAVHDSPHGKRLQYRGGREDPSSSR